MSSFAIASQIRDFAVNPATQSLIVSDASMLQTLMNFLNDKSSDNPTLLKCVESFHGLAKNVECRSHVAELPGLLLRLSDLCEYDEGDDHETIAKFSKETLEYISGKDDKNVEKVVLPTVTVNRAGAFSTRGYIHNMIVHVPDMNTNEHRVRVEAAVIGTKGLVSVTIDNKSKNLVIYSSMKAQDFIPKIAEALETIGFTCQEAQDKSSGPDPTAKTTTTKKPGYAKKPAVAGNDAVVRYVDANSKNTEDTNGWFGSISGYFW